MDDRYLELVKEFKSLADDMVHLSADMEEHSVDVENDRYKDYSTIYLGCAADIYKKISEYLITDVEYFLNEDDRESELEYYRNMPILKILSELESENMELRDKAGKKVSWEDYRLMFKTNGINEMKNKVTCTTSSTSYPDPKDE